jgi:hypothetical protein
MNRREVGFLLIGSGLGLLLSCVAVIEMSLWLHHMFIFEIHWQAYLWAAIPWVLPMIGATMIRRRSTI